MSQDADETLDATIRKDAILVKEDRKLACTYCNQDFRLKDFRHLDDHIRRFHILRGDGGCFVPDYEYTEVRKEAKKYTYDYKYNGLLCVYCKIRRIGHDTLYIKPQSLTEHINKHCGKIIPLQKILENRENI